MKRHLLSAPLLSTALLLAACQSAPLQQQAKGPQTAQTVALNTTITEAYKHPVFEGQIQIQAQGNQASVSFVPQQRADFTTQALRRSDITQYRMTVTWPGNTTGRSTTIAAGAGGAFPGSPLTVTSIPRGDFRIIKLEALAGNTPIKELDAGYVYNFASTTTFDATGMITRSGNAVANIISYFANSTVAADVDIFTAWKTAPAGTITDLKQLVEDALGAKDPIALDMDDLISEIQAQATPGDLPDSSSIDTYTLQDITLTYEVPAGYILPAGTRLSLNTATSAVTEIPAPQIAGTYTVTIPNVVLPTGGDVKDLDLRFFSASDTGYSTPYNSADSVSLSIDNAGLVAASAGSSTNALKLPDNILNTVNASTTFYANANAGSDALGITGADGAEWATIAHALSEIKAQGPFAPGTVPTLILEDNGNFNESGLTVDFPIQIIGAGNATLAGTGTGINLAGGTGAPTSSTERITISNLKMTGFTKAINVQSDVSHVTLSSINAQGTGVAYSGAGIAFSGVGFNVPSSVSVNDLILNNSKFNLFKIGMAVSASNFDDASTFENVKVSNTDFSNNTHKGVYIEKASNVSFDQITINHSGTEAASNDNNGFMLYLKGNSALPAKTYSNVSLTNSTITDSAYMRVTPVGVFPSSYARAAVVMGVREVGAHFASLDGLTITGNTISGPMQGLRIAAPDGNLGASGTMISNITLENNTLAFESNPAYDNETGPYTPAMGYAFGRFMLINHTRGDITASTGNTFDGIDPATAVGTDALKVRESILDVADTNRYQANSSFELGEVISGLPSPLSFTVPFQADATHIQRYIDAAQVGDTVMLADGTYTPASTLNITINKDITLKGQSLAGTIFSRTGANASGLFRLMDAGASISDMTITKTDKTGPDALIYLGANNLTVENMRMSGQYVNGDSDVSRAMVGQSGITGLLVQNNEIFELRQPAYINGAATLTGTITNNKVYGTRGWVIQGAMINFTGNTWRSDGLAGVSGNFGCDIALLSDDLAPNPTTYFDFYGDTTALEADNSGDLLDLVGAGMGGCDQRLNNP